MGDRNMHDGGNNIVGDLKRKAVEHFTSQYDHFSSEESVLSHDYFRIVNVGYHHPSRQFPAGGARSLLVDALHSNSDKSLDQAKVMQKLLDGASADAGLRDTAKDIALLLAYKTNVEGMKQKPEGYPEKTLALAIERGVSDLSKRLDIPQKETGRGSPS